MNRFSKISPFHRGEVSVQKAFGVAEEAFELGTSMIHPAVGEHVFSFLMSLPFLILALVDVQSSPTNASSPWSSMMYGRNFMSIERSGKRIDFKGGRLSNAQNDPLSDVIFRAQGTREVTPLVIPMAIMGIDFARRRRYRINGYASLDRKQVEEFTPLSLSFTFHVLEAYGNCPKECTRLAPLSSVVHQILFLIIYTVHSSARGPSTPTSISIISIISCGDQVRCSQRPCVVVSRRRRSDSPV